jgi:hypothetical protein
MVETYLNQVRFKLVCVLIETILPTAKNVVRVIYLIKVWGQHNLHIQQVVANEELY